MLASELEERGDWIATASAALEVQERRANAVAAQAAELEGRWQRGGGASAIPSFPAGDAVKVPAAWLVERAGFPKGYRLGGAGVSERHALALVNLGGTSAELLALADAIRAGVERRFGITLECEPEVVR